MNSKIHQDTMSYYSTRFQKYGVDETIPTTIDFNTRN